MLARRFRPLAAVGAILIAATGLLAFPMSASAAAVWTVQTNVDNTDNGSLRWAASHAISGDTITFDASVTAIALQGVVSIRSGVNVSGPGSDLLTISRAGDGAYGLFEATNIDTDGVIFSGMTLDGTVGNGTLIGLSALSNGTVSIDDVSFVNADGGAIFQYAGNGLLSISHSLFDSGTEASAISFNSYSGSVSVSDTVFSNNSTPGPGAVLALHGPDSDTASDVSFTDVEFSNNAAGSYGGALLLDDVDAVTFTNVYAHDNSAESYGGFAAILTANTLAIDESRFVANDTASVGGALQVNNLTGELTVTDSTFDGNTADYDAAAIGLPTIYASSSVYNTVFENNVAGASGAALFGGYVYTGSLSITSSTFRNNTAGSSGGAILSYGVDPGSVDGLIITNSSFYDNLIVNGSASAGQSISFNSLSGPARIEQTTFDEPDNGHSTSVVEVNYLGSEGAGHLAISRSTIVGVGGVRISGVTDSSTASVSNSIVDGGLAVGGAYAGFELPVTYSLIAGDAGDSITVGTGATFTVEDFGLETLANNGGPTLTRLPFRTGPAYNAADPAVSGGLDQRGKPRTADGRTDIGATELDSQYFADVTDPNNDFYDYIQWMAASGVSTGTPQPSGLPVYNPAAAVSRQAMAAFLYRLSGDTFVAPAVPTFADVPTTSQFYLQIEWMAASAISTGTPQSSGKPLYKPADPVSRQSMALFLTRYEHVPGLDVPPTSQTFADVPTTASTAAAIEWMYEAGISTGTPQASGLPLYKPLDPVSRLAMSAFLYRIAHL